MSAKPWITPSEAEKVAKKVAEEVVKEAQPGDLVQTNVTNTPAGQPLSNIVIDGVRYDLNNLTEGSIIGCRAIVNSLDGNTSFDNRFKDVLTERYGEDNTKWPTYPLYTFLTIESDTSTWTEMGMLIVDMSHNVITFSSLARNNTEWDFTYNERADEFQYDGIINNYAVEIGSNSPVTDIAASISVGGENYQIESHEYSPQLYVHINTERSSIFVREDELTETKMQLGGQMPGYFFCEIYCTIDGTEYAPFFGYVDIIEQEYLSIYTDREIDFCATLNYDANNKVYATSDPGFNLPYVTSDLAQHLEETTGESIPVEEIHDLWIPQERKFVKVGGGGGSTLYVHNLYFYGHVGGSDQWFCLQYKSFSSEENVVTPTFASELCDLQLNDHIWHQWHEHDAHLYHATVEINEEPPSTIKADDELTVTGALASSADQLFIGFVENGEGKNLIVNNIDTRHQVYEMIQPAYVRPEDADYYWPFE